MPQVRLVYAREGQWLGFTICDGLGMQVSSHYISSWPCPKDILPPHRLKVLAHYAHFGLELQLSKNHTFKPPLANGLGLGQFFSR